jgi:hypothetical protein
MGHVRKFANRNILRMSIRHDAFGEQSPISHPSELHSAVRASAFSDISGLRTNFLPCELAACGIEQKDLVVGTLPNAQHKATEFRLTAGLVRLDKILGLDGKSVGNEVLPHRYGCFGSEEKATDHSRRQNAPKR